MSGMNRGSGHVCIRLATEADVPLVASAIRTAFRGVAERFHLTSENCPRHPSNCTPEWIRADIEKGIAYYVLECDGAPCGCVGTERRPSDTCYMKRLAVLPDRRNRGFGRALVLHVIEEARRQGLTRVELGTIAEHTELRRWYERLGFVVKETCRFEQLPFEVTYMFMNL